MRLLAFTYDTQPGRVPRLGLLAGHDVVDVNLAYRQLLSRRVSMDRADALAAKLAPPEMIPFLGTGAIGVDILHEISAAVPELTAMETDSPATRITYPKDVVIIKSPLPRPASIRDCSAFEEHVRNASGHRGVPDQWYRHPTYYKGNPAAVVGTDVPVRRPAEETRMDYELEFAVVIGTPGRDIGIAETDNHIAGYTVFNDVSCRDRQFAEMRVGLGPAKGKDFDGSNVLGPYLVTADEFDPAQPHAMVARVDGEEWSRGSTDTLHYSVAEIVSYISRDETLYPGDVIGVGTVGGGCGLELGRYPEMGQEVELEVDGLGRLCNRFVDATL